MNNLADTRCSPFASQFCFTEMFEEMDKDLQETIRARLNLRFLPRIAFVSLDDFGNGEAWR